MLETSGAASIGTSHTFSGIDPKEISSRIRSATRTPRVKPHEYRTDKKDPVDHVKNIFGESGELEHSLPDFEHRPEQIEMAKAVSEAIDFERHLVVEAGTGVREIPRVSYSRLRCMSCVPGQGSLFLLTPLIAGTVGK